MRKIPRTTLVAATLMISVVAVLAPMSYTLAANPEHMAMSMLAVTGQPPPDPANCSPNVIPVGQSNPPGSESEPMAPIWCFPLANPVAPTRVSGANSWIDTFTGDTQMGRFNDGDYDYKVYDNIGSPSIRTQHFTNNNHWMIDRAGDGEGGAMISPNRSFRFEGGKLVLEGDVAAGITAYNPETWVEMTISTGPAVTRGQTNDNLYSYGQFVGFTSFGCRITTNSEAYCAHMGAQKISNPQFGQNCFEGDDGWRYIEISGGQRCGTVHSGDFRGGTAAQYARQCDSAAQIPDMQCRDRYRMEISQNGLVFYVNGFKYFEDSDWPARNQLPANITNGSVPVYAYFADFGSVHGQEPALRYHWQRLAVNPGTPPSASPSFCLGQPGSTCAMGATPVPPTNTAVVPPTATSVPPTSTSVPATSVPPTATSIPATATPGVAPCRVRVSINGGPDEYRDQPNSFCGLP